MMINVGKLNNFFLLIDFWANLRCVFGLLLNMMLCACKCLCRLYSRESGEVSLNMKHIK